jgi:hypothetical protein
MTQEKEELAAGSGMRPTAAELYGALTELQSSAAAYVQGLETENRRLREALIAARERCGYELHPLIDAALKEGPEWESER